MSGLWDNRGLRDNKFPLWRTFRIYDDNMITLMKVLVGKKIIALVSKKIKTWLVKKKKPKPKNLTTKSMVELSSQRPIKEYKGLVYEIVKRKVPSQKNTNIMKSR